MWLFWQTKIGEREKTIHRTVQNNWSWVVGLKNKMNSLSRYRESTAETLKPPDPLPTSSRAFQSSARDGRPAWSRCSSGDWSRMIGEARTWCQRGPGAGRQPGFRRLSISSLRHWPSSNLSCGRCSALISIECLYNSVRILWGPVWIFSLSLDQCILCNCQKLPIGGTK